MNSSTFIWQNMLSSNSVWFVWMRMALNSCLPSVWSFHCKWQTWQECLCADFSVDITRPFLPSRIRKWEVSLYKKSAVFFFLILVSVLKLFHSRFILHSKLLMLVHVVAKAGDKLITLNDRNTFATPQEIKIFINWLHVIIGQFD